MKMTTEKLQQAMEIQKQIDALQKQMEDIFSSNEEVNRVNVTPTQTKRKMSKAGRQKIAEAQRLRHQKNRLEKEKNESAPSTEGQPA